MPEITHRGRSDQNERKVIVLEFVAASSVFLLIALVLYLVFTYQPS